MKTLLLLPFLLLATFNLFSQNEVKKSDTLLLQPIEIKAIRAGDNAPFTKTNLSKEQIEKENSGQDLPFILNQTPSVVVSSDAGNGIGYTGIRIRGTDASRINVTLNGIPYNDAESQGTFFVDLPDVASSVNSIQIQRGAGTSSNGSGAFGATINLSTNEINDKFYAELNNGFGSFNTWKHTLKIGSGLFKKHFTIDARLSDIKSDGYIDRAAANLRSFFISTAYLGKNNSLRLNIFSGKEKTYQAWYGISKNYLDTNRTYNEAGTQKPGKPYENETDNYIQTHYQLFYNQKINSHVSFNTAIFLTKGKGYYEEYRASEKFFDYGLADFYNGAELISETDLIRQLWLNNNFYGTIFSLQQKSERSQFTLGGGWNRYNGKHYGIVKWAGIGFPQEYHFYDLTANKTDFTIYAKLQQRLTAHWQGFADLQSKAVKYIINGFREHPDLVINKKYFFLNPKAGITFNKNNYQAYLSYSIAKKEPNRDDFEAGINQLPLPEILQDIELGAGKKTSGYSYEITGYYMYYHNQLLLTGKINDVGAYTRTNTPSSYRLGMEMQGTIEINSWMNAAANFALSRNKIKTFIEYVDDYDDYFQKTFEYKNTNISFSPSVIYGATLRLVPLKNSELSILGKYTGKQYLDNTSKKARTLNPFYVQDVKVTYTFSKKLFKQVEFLFKVNNIFNKKYEPNGFTFSYFSGGNLSTENYYFPMAGINFMTAMNIKL